MNRNESSPCGAPASRIPARAGALALALASLCLGLATDAFAQTREGASVRQVHKWVKQMPWGPMFAYMTRGTPEGGWSKVQTFHCFAQQVDGTVKIGFENEKGGRPDVSCGGATSAEPGTAALHRKHRGPAWDGSSDRKTYEYYTDTSMMMENAVATKMNYGRVWTGYIVTGIAPPVATQVPGPPPPPKPIQVPVNTGPTPQQQQRASEMDNAYANACPAVMPLRLNCQNGARLIARRCANALNKIEDEYGLKIAQLGPDSSQAGPLRSERTRAIDQKTASCKAELDAYIAQQTQLKPVVPIPQKLPPNFGLPKP
jgi:hypothetical protein